MCKAACGSGGYQGGQGGGLARTRGPRDQQQTMRVRAQSIKHDGAPMSVLKLGTCRRDARHTEDQPRDWANTFTRKRPCTRPYRRRCRGLVAHVSSAKSVFEVQGCATAAMPLARCLAVVGPRQLQVCSLPCTRAMGWQASAQMQVRATQCKGLRKPMFSSWCMGGSCYSPIMDELAKRYQAVRERITQAALQAGRSPDSVQLLVVSKTFGADKVAQVAALGQRDFGENYVQEAWTKSRHSKACRAWCGIALAPCKATKPARWPSI
jgi:hypothetical protein